MSKYGSRLDPIGIDRHGRRYMMMPNYAGLIIQSFGSEEWIKDEDGAEYFGILDIFYCEYEYEGDICMER